MGVEFKQSNATPELKPQDVLLDGETIGEVKPCMYGSDGKVTWHCCIRGKFGLIGLVQGRSDTMPKSVVNAVQTGYAEATLAVEEITKLAKRLGVELKA